MQDRRRALSVLLACALGLVAGAGAAGTAQADLWNKAPGTSHWYNYASHKCLAVLTEAATAGFPVDQYDRHNGAAQGWGQERAARIVDHRSGGCNCTFYVYLGVNHNGGNCMAAADASGANGSGSSGVRV